MIRLALVLVVVAVFVLLLVVPEVDRRLNQVWLSPPYEVPPEARRVHDRLLVADLHADFLLWRRDLPGRYRRGHLDLPRLLEGNVSLQVFSVVTKSPWGQNYHRNTGDSDRITYLAVAQAWPVKAWGSLRERALYQAERLQKATENGHLSLLLTARDVDRFLIRRAGGSVTPAALLAMEGMHPVGGEIENIDVFFEAGFRMMAPVHMFDNGLGGSAHGAERGGLTDFGRRSVERMNELQIIIDLAHASPQTIDDVLDMATRPVVVSHTGVQGTCSSPRNLDDAQIRRIAENRGLIGIGLWDGAVCGTSVDDVVRAIRYTVDLVGVDHVGIGSDFDGTVRTIFDVRGMPLLTASLLKNGFSQDEIVLIMGGNVVRLLRESMPEHRARPVTRRE